MGPVNITDTVRNLQRLTTFSVDAIKQVITTALKGFTETTGADLAVLQVMLPEGKQHIKVFADQVVKTHNLPLAKQFSQTLKQSDFVATALQAAKYNAAIKLKDPNGEQMPIVVDLRPTKDRVKEYTTAVANAPQVIRTAEPAAALDAGTVSVSAAEPVATIIAYGGPNAMPNAIKLMLSQIARPNGEPYDVG